MSEHSATFSKSGVSATAAEEAAYKSTLRTLESALELVALSQRNDDFFNGASAAEVIQARILQIGKTEDGLDYFLNGRRTEIAKLLAIKEQALASIDQLMQSLEEQADV